MNRGGALTPQGGEGGIAGHLVFLDFSFWARIVATIVCGSVIGWERIHSHKPVGVRTRR
jgi:hypothetical protein